MYQCFKCGAEWRTGKSRPAFADTCGQCGAYLHCCRNCRFHEPGRHNQCRVPGTEMVRDRALMNHCDEFVFRKEHSDTTPRDEASNRAARDVLFGGEDAPAESDANLRERLLGPSPETRRPQDAFDDLFKDE